MGKINQTTMRAYLCECISSINKNKINGMLAEIDLRNTLQRLGFGDKISQGGWIFRNVGPDIFGSQTFVLFPETIYPNKNYKPGRILKDPPLGLHTICSTMHQIGVHSFYGVPSITTDNDSSSITWAIKQLGIPVNTNYAPLIPTIKDFQQREKRYNFLRYKTNAKIIPSNALAEEFTKEHIRVTFQNTYLSETSDIDGIFWGQQYTYPVEIKEKTVAFDSKVGEYFGLDVGPFVKLAFYAAKKGNLHSLFFVREINNTENRQLVDWWFITFDIMAQFASWVIQGGGKNMNGGNSTVVKIPKKVFTHMTPESLANL